MGSSRHPSIFILLILPVVLSAPTSLEKNGRVVRSVNSHRSSPSWSENPMANLLLLQQQHQQQQSNRAGDSDLQAVLRQRENKTGDGISYSSTSGDGSNDEEIGDDINGGGGANGALGNDTHVGSRFKQNETEPCNLEPNVLCLTDPAHSNRDKARRMTAIYHFFESIFNRTRPNKEMSKERFPPMAPTGSSSFSGDIKTITASCDLPSEVESEAWLSERYLNLFFNVTSKYPEIFGSNQDSENSTSQHQNEQQSFESGQSHEHTSTTGTRPFLSIPSRKTKLVSIVSAKLRLYKVGLSESGTTTLSFSNTIPNELYNDTTLRGDEVVPNEFSTAVTFPRLSPNVEERVRVSVSWYTQPATKNHYKKKTLDSKMLAVRESGWIEFDIKNAVQAWLNHGIPNYGLVIEVESENQDSLEPTRHFGSSSCFKTSSAGGDLVYGKNENGINIQGNGFNMGKAGDKKSISTLPSIEICTLNVPERRQYNVQNILPNVINIHSFNHLKGVAESHAKANNRNGTSNPAFWQNVNVQIPSDIGINFPDVNSRTRNNDDDREEKPTSTVIVPGHRHRHHHELSSQNRSRANGHNSESLNKQDQQQDSTILDEDHPLRAILATTVNGNSKESSRRGSYSSSSSKSFGIPSHLKPEMLADEGRNGEDSNEHKPDGFFSTIIMTPEQLKENAKNGFQNSGIFPFPIPIPSTSSTDSEER